MSKCKKQISQIRNREEMKEGRVHSYITEEAVSESTTSHLVQQFGRRLDLICVNLNEVSGGFVEGVVHVLVGLLLREIFQS